MSIKNFWLLFLKALGIWLIVNSLPTAFHLIILVMSWTVNSTSNWSTFVEPTVQVLLIVIFYVLILWLFVFKTSWLVHKLKLVEGFDETRIEFKIRHTSVIAIASIVIGGLLFVDSLPNLITETIKYFEQKRMFQPEISSGMIFFYLIKTVFGYLLMTNSRNVVKFIENNRKIARVIEPDSLKDEKDK